MNKIFKITATLFFLLIVFFPTTVFADMGPKPTVDIKVTYNNLPVKDRIFFGALFSCRQNPGGDLSRLENEMSDYSDKEIDSSVFAVNDYDLERKCYWGVYGLSWGFKCKDSICNFRYMIPSEFKVGIYLPDENRFYLSEPIRQSAFHSTYSANLLENGAIEIKNKTHFYKTNLFKYFLFYVIALVFTIIIELSASGWFISKNLNKAKIERTIIYANLISLTLLWLVLFLTFKNTEKFTLALLIGEISIFIFEWLFIYFLNKKSITLIRSFSMAFVMNLVSFIIGAVFFMAISLFGFLAF